MCLKIWCDDPTYVKIKKIKQKVTCMKFDIKS